MLHSVLSWESLLGGEAKRRFRQSSRASLMFNLTTIKWALVATALLGAFASGMKIGRDGVQAAWNAEKAAMNADAAEQIQQAMNKALATERESAKKVAEVSAKYQAVLKEKHHAEAAAVERARTNGLYVNAHCPAAADPVSDVAASTGGHHGEARVRLSEEDGEFLVRLAAEADRITEQLSACQAILESERK